MSAAFRASATAPSGRSEPSAKDAHENRATWFSLAIAAAIVLMLGTALVLAQDFNDSARQLPVFIGVPTSLLALAALVVEAVRIWRSRSASDSDPFTSTWRGTVRVLVVFGGLAVTYLLLGFPWGAALFLFAFLLASRRTGIRKGALITVAVIVPTYFIFAEQLEIPVFSGLLGL